MEEQQRPTRIDQQTFTIHGVDGAAKCSGGTFNVIPPMCCAGVRVPTEAIHPNHQSHTMIWTARLPPRFPFTMLRFTPSIPTPTECTCTDTEQRLQITADFDHWETGVTFKVTTQRKLRTSTSTSTHIEGYESHMRNIKRSENQKHEMGTLAAK